MSDTVTLYHGDNGSQEFYEDEGSRLIVWRLHGGPGTWTGYRMASRHRLDVNGSVWGETAEHAIRRLADRTGLRLAVDASQEWRLLKPSHKRMRLVEVEA